MSEKDFFKQFTDYKMMLYLDDIIWDGGERYTLKELIEQNHGRVSELWSRKLIRLSPHALCYLIRVRNVREKICKVPLSDFPEEDMWEVLDCKLAEYRKLKGESDAEPKENRS